ncbi:Spg1/Tem1 GTP-binding protein [Aspergillus homomorphus CBS 101889]|uniref:GTP binding protein n=1 Tax=Aspergillus homomorphus (strain CBS 101889) TaxID=1450537 RepID=A0A395HZ96_ASPHC|nr:GTP binding protein [Aspergillus homomorphus CBS 101889]RAL13252.1 GTP binding protein [Aspergillus homomorphus CBS 101889]
MDAQQLHVAGISESADQLELDQAQTMDLPTPTQHGIPAGPDETTIANGYSSDSRAHYSSHDFHSPTRDYHSQDGEAPRSSHPSQLPSSSRPSSGLSNHPDRLVSQPLQDVSQKQTSSQAKNSVVIKVGMVGDAQIGKTSLMVKYVEGSWDEDYIQTLGVNFMEKTISIRNTEITFSIWDLGGQREFVNMLPLVCNDAVAILFMFDLTRKSTLNSIKEWYRQGRGFNKTAIPFLIGTKYDHFVNFPREDQEEISIQAKRFAKAMKASLIFSSTSHSINVQKIFKIVLAKAFDLKCTIPEIENIGEPLLLYKNV